jgi:glycosyltransferase involved in cell wall biosynthesis
VTAVFLGRFGERKGIFDLIAAISALPPAVRDRLRLVAAGDGEVEQARAAVRDAGLERRIEIRDWLAPAERDALLGRAQLFVLPSSNEGLPMALLEAMAWGLAPVVTPVGGIGDVVTDGGNGILVPPRDRSALTAALERLLTDDEERAKLGAAARESVAAYAAPQWAARLVGLWSDIAK